MSSDLLERMRRNPAGDGVFWTWRCSNQEYSLLFRPGKGTSHCHLKHPSAAEILTIPAHRTIKPVYIRKLVHYIDRYGGD